MYRAIKLLIPALLAILFFAHCKKLDIDANCLNSLSSCFKPDKTAPLLKSYTPIPNKGSNLVSVLTGIQVNFSEEMKDRTNKENYKLSGPGAAGLSIESITDAGGSSVIVNLKGTVANNAINLSFPGLTDYGGNTLSAGTQATLTGSINIGITTQEAPTIYYISNVAGFTSAVIHWYHDYADDNNNLYYVQPTGSTCADPQVAFPGGGTNMSGGPVTAGAANVVTTTIPIATNFTTDGTYIVTICIKNSGANKSGELEIPIVRDTVAPVIQANIGSGAYGSQQDILFTCSDNCDNLAYISTGGTTMPANPAAPTFNATGGVTLGTKVTGLLRTPLTSDPWFSKVNLKAFDKAGNQSAATIFSYQIDTLLPTTTFASPATTHDYVSSLAGGYNSTVLTWSADKGSQYQICVGDTGAVGVSGCSAGPACNGGTNLFGTAQPYTPGNSIGTTINASSLTAGANRVHVCVQSGATVGDATYTLTRDVAAPVIASTIPADVANGVIPATSITVNFTETVGIDVSTISAAVSPNPGDQNITKVACTGSIQVSLASDNFGAGTCIPMVSATPVTVSSTVYKINPLRLLTPGLYKIRITNAIRDIAGNPIAATLTQATGFTVTGLLRMFTFNNDGTNLTDQANSGQNLTANGGPQKVMGVDGDTNGAYRFDGTGNQYLTGADSMLPTGNSPRTMCAWLNIAGGCPGYCIATMYGAANGPYLGAHNGLRAATAYYNEPNLDSNTNLPLNTWVHVCSAYNGSLNTLYLNGVADGSQNYGAIATVGGGNFRIGKQAPDDAFSYFFNGRVDDVRVYAGALSVAEIRQIAVQVPNGLLAYYSFSDAASGTANDYSGNNHPGVRNGAPLPTISTDRFGVTGAYSFGGPSQYISAQDTNLPQGTAPRTVCSWMRPTALPGSGQFRIAMRYGQPLAGQSNYIGLYNDGVQQTVIFSGWTDHLTSPYTAATNTWMHLCGTYDGTTARLYLNGGLVASAAKAWNTTLMGNNGIIIGQGDLTGTFPFQGAVDDVRIYNRVLTDNEILVLSSQLGVGLLRQYSFANGGLADDAGSGNSLTASGSPAQVNGVDGAANGAYSFSGADQFSANDAGLPAGGAARTMCSWVYVTTANTDSFAISYGAAQTTSQGSFLYVDSSNQAGFGSYSTNLQSTYVVPVSAWHHLCATLDSTGNGRVYIDGNLAPGGGPTPVTFSTVLSGNLAIAARSDNAFRWRGSLDSVRIYNRALEAPEILQLQGY